MCTSPAVARAVRPQNNKSELRDESRVARRVRFIKSCHVHEASETIAVRTKQKRTNKHNDLPSTVFDSVVADWLLILCSCAGHRGGAEAERRSERSRRAPVSSSSMPLPQSAQLHQPRERCGRVFFFINF